MAAETAAVREKGRRVKTHILDQYLKLADRVDAKGYGDLSDAETTRYWQLTDKFSNNVIPRTQEVTGEDGGALNVNLIKYGDNITPFIPAETIPVATPESV